jgi:hypothetical protein
VEFVRGRPSSTLSSRVRCKLSFLSFVGIACSAQLDQPGMYVTTQTPNSQLAVAHQSNPPYEPQTVMHPFGFNIHPTDVSRSMPGPQVYGPVVPVRDVGTDGIRTAAKAKRKNDPAFVCGTCGADFTSKHNLKCTPCNVPFEPQLILIDIDSSRNVSSGIEELYVYPLLDTFLA